MSVCVSLCVCLCVCVQCHHVSQATKQAKQSAVSWVREWEWEWGIAVVVYEFTRTHTHTQLYVCIYQCAIGLATGRQQQPQGPQTPPPNHPLLSVSKRSFGYEVASAQRRLLRTTMMMMSTMIMTSTIILMMTRCLKHLKHLTRNVVSQDQLSL